MTVAAAIPSPREFFAKTFDGYHGIGHAAQELWEKALFEATGFGTRGCFRTDEELGATCGRSRRWVQKALKQLCDRIVGTLPRPAIDRSRHYGPAREGSRVITIIVNYVAPAEPAPDAPPSSAPARKGRKVAPGTNTPAPAPLAPEQLAAGQAAVAEAEASAAPAEDVPQTAEGRKAMVDRLRATIGLPPRAEAPGLEVAPPPARRLSREELKAQIAARRRAERDQDGPAGQPSGP